MFNFYRPFRTSILCSLFPAINDGAFIGLSLWDIFVLDFVVNIIILMIGEFPGTNKFDDFFGEFLTTDKY